MELKRKLTVLANAAKHDASCASGGSFRKTPDGGIGNAEGMGICHSYTPDGRCVSLLKILLTNYCIYDCRYCESRISSNTPRERFTPAEVVTLTLDFYKRNYIEGLFLSSGVIKSPDYTMEQLAEVARALREDHAFGGYIHLKAPPGASQELLRAAGKHADRLSVNVELPTQADLDVLAPEKSFSAIEQVMGDVKYGIDDAKDLGARWAPAGQTTQMVIGATPSTDRTILETSGRLYEGYGLRRVYYAAFSPIVHADRWLPGVAPPLVREHRLYEADWLVRRYGFRLEELFDPGEETGGPPAIEDLDLEIDPKLAWALRHRGLFPVDVNHAPREMLLRVPGLGVRNVDRILVARRHGALRIADLRRLRVALRRAAPFLLTADGPGLTRHLDEQSLRARVRPAQQLALFGAQGNASTGEL
ncbi:MAG: hypothetical protein JWP97_2088 [Labilithrix sp.]|nr:hypothetical protein [Labilithrix sp.]